jgi:NADH-quinone oxidoreductase subunit M
VILILLVAIPFLAGVLAWLLGRVSKVASLLAAILPLLGALILLLVTQTANVTAPGDGEFFADVKVPWIPQLGVTFHFSMDGLSFILAVLTLAVGILALVASWKKIDHGVGFFHFCMLWVISGIMGVFLATDLFLFFFFWEFMLAPMYFVIANWGHEHRGPSALKFFIFTSVSGLVMLLAILALSVAHYRATGVLSFDLMDIAGLALPARTATLAMLGFAVAFGVKLPVVPVHTWLPDAHTEAPESGSVILAALLLKTGAYGFIRFVAYLFPGPVETYSLIFMTVGVVGVVYGALLSFAQDDFKRLVAYSSISHMGFVILGIFARTEQGFLGALLLIVSHSASSAALFIIAGFLNERLGTRDIRTMGGLISALPKLSTAGIVFTLGAIGLPGLGIFTGEMLVLIGTARVSVVHTIVGSLGIVLAALYGLRLLGQVFFGDYKDPRKLWDLTFREGAMMVALFVTFLWFGVYPHPVFKAVRGSVISPAHGVAALAAEAEGKEARRGTPALALGSAPLETAPLEAAPLEAAPLEAMGDRR